MSILVGWTNSNKNTIQYNIQGSWTWLEMEAALQQNFMMSATVSHPVDVVVDLRHSQPFPDDGLLFFKNALKALPENCGHIIFIGGGNTLRSLVSLLKNQARSHAHRLHNVESPRQADLLMKQLLEKRAVA